MRNIMFRAWDTVEKHFVGFELFKGANKHTPPMYQHAQLEEWEMFVLLENHPHLNGLYEGDIVKHSEGIDVVIFDDGMFQLQKHDGRPFYYYTNIEYIGNIHENPELLKENNGTKEEV